MVGASDEPWRPSFGVAAYLKRAGYRVLPVNPTIAGRTLHGETVRAALTDLAEPVDIVNVFRRPAFVPEVVEAAIAIGAPVVWMQLGVRHDGAKARAEAAGLAVVDRSLHQRRAPPALSGSRLTPRSCHRAAELPIWPASTFGRTTGPLRLPGARSDQLPKYRRTGRAPSGRPAQRAHRDVRGMPWKPAP